MCCFSKSKRYVTVTGNDWSRLGNAAETFADFCGRDAYMRMDSYHCAALKPRQTGPGEVEYFCTLYPQRPQICRDVKRGSVECQGERMRKAEWVARERFP